MLIVVSFANDWQKSQINKFTFLNFNRRFLRSNGNGIRLFGWGKGSPWARKIGKPRVTGLREH